MDAVPARNFATERQREQWANVAEDEKRIWNEVKVEVNNYNTSCRVYHKADKTRARFPDHSQTIAERIVKKLNQLGYWVRIVEQSSDAKYGFCVNLKWALKKPCSIFKWHPPIDT
jgi:hypothetical protein